jgi:rhodanese-related sulfurtransferase
MGLLRNLARKVVDRVVGGPTVPGPREASPVPRTPTPERGTPETTAAEPVADAEALATIEAGAQEVRERLEAGEPVTLLDVREPAEIAAGIIPGARCIPLGQLRERWRELERCDEIVCYCAMGGRSLAAAELLRANGLFNATSLEGGIAAWRAIGGAVAAPPSASV